MISRRGFLGAILASCAAPAICKAEHLMRIAAPRGYALAGGILTPDQGPALTGDFTLESWIPPAEGSLSWRSIIVISRHSKLGPPEVLEYIDGHRVPPGTLPARFTRPAPPVEVPIEVSIKEYLS